MCVQLETAFSSAGTTYGEAYNTQKFLQEYELHPKAGLEPRALMSEVNQDLGQVNLEIYQSGGGGCFFGGGGANSDISCVPLELG